MSVSRPTSDLGRRAELDLLTRNGNPGVTGALAIRRLSTTDLPRLRVGEPPEWSARPWTHKSRLVSSGWSMSALPTKADIRQRIEYVCFVPTADLAQQANT
jgi:hypothetical protein